MRVCFIKKFLHIFKDIAHRFPCLGDKYSGKHLSRQQWHVASINNNMAPCNLASIHNNMASIKNNIANINNNMASAHNYMASINNNIANVDNNMASINNNIENGYKNTTSIDNNVAPCNIFPFLTLKILGHTLHDERFY